MARTREPYFFELPGPDATVARDVSLNMVGKYINRPNLTPAAVFETTSEVVRALADERRSSVEFDHSNRQNAVAKAMDVTPGAVARLELEAGAVPPREPNLRKLQEYASALGYEVWLVCIPTHRF